MATPIRLPLVGFHGLDANRGPVRCQRKNSQDFSDEDVQQYREDKWAWLRENLPILKEGTWPESIEEIDSEVLKQTMCPDDEDEKLRSIFIFLTDDGASARRTIARDYYSSWKRACDPFDRYSVLKALLPVVNIVSGILKIVLGISKDGAALGVVPEDRWKFKATLIAVGIAEVCFLGLIVHGVASLYFAMTSLEPQPLLN